MHPAVQRLRESMAGVLFGGAVSIDRVICCLLARGHLLIEDVPGVGKTLAIKEWMSRHHIRSYLACTGTIAGSMQSLLLEIAGVLNACWVNS